MCKSDKKKKSTFKKIRSIAICVLLAVIVGGFILSLVMEHRFEREIEKIEAAGEPVTFDEMWEGLPEISERENAARYYKAALSLMIRRYLEYDLINTVVYGYVNFPEVELTQEKMKMIENHLEENLLAFDLVDQAAQIPACLYCTRLENSDDFYSRDLGKGRHLIKLLSLRTRYHMMQGRADEATESLNSSLRVLRMLESNSMLIGVLVKAACMRLVIDDIQIVAEQGGPDRATLEGWAKELLQLEELDYVREAAIAERVNVIQDMSYNKWYYYPYTEECRGCLKYPEESTVEKFMNKLGWYVYDWKSYEEGDKKQDWYKHMLQARELRNWAKLIALLENKWPGDYELVKDLCEQDDEFKTGRLMDVLPALKIYGRFLSASRSARVMCAIERYRLDESGLPGLLAELVPGYMEAIPLDPFTGKELIYRQDETGYAVYGLGENLKDDGATANALKNNKDCGVRIRTIINDETEQSEESGKEESNTKYKRRWLRGDEQRPRGEGRRGRGRDEGQGANNEF